MSTFMKLYAACLPVALALDALWLGFVARSFYRKHLGYVFADEFAWGAAIAFYLLHAAGLVFFCILPSLEKLSIAHLVIACVAFGLVTYGTYDLTNQATIRDWPRVVTVVDMAWGALFSTLVGMAGYWIGLRIVTS